MALIIREGVGPPMRHGLWSKVRARLAGLRDHQRLFGKLVGVVAAFVIVIMRQWRKVIDGRFLDAPVVERPNIAIHMRDPIDPKWRLPDGGRIIGGGGYVHSLTPQIICGC